MKVFKDNTYFETVDVKIQIPYYAWENHQRENIVRITKNSVNDSLICTIVKHDCVGNCSISNDRITVFSNPDNNDKIADSKISRYLSEYQLKTSKDEFDEAIKCTSKILLGNLTL